MLLEYFQRPGLKLLSALIQFSLKSFMMAKSGPASDVTVSHVFAVHMQSECTLHPASLLFHRMQAGVLGNSIGTYHFMI